MTGGASGDFIRFLKEFEDDIPFQRDSRRILRLAFDVIFHEEWLSDFLKYNRSAIPCNHETTEIYSVALTDIAYTPRIFYGYVLAFWTKEQLFLRNLRTPEEIVIARPCRLPSAKISFFCDFKSGFIHVLFYCSSGTRP